MSLLHPMSVHFPLVFPVLQLLAVIFYWRFERQSWIAKNKLVNQKFWRALLVVMFFALLADIAAYWTGVQDASHSPLSRAHIDQHIFWAQLFMVAGFCSLILTFAIFRSIGSLRYAGWLRSALLLSSVSKLSLAVLTGHFGGVLVFGS